MSPLNYFVLGVWHKLKSWTIYDRSDKVFEMSVYRILFVFLSLLFLTQCATSGRNKGDINMYSTGQDAKLGAYWASQIPKMMPLLFDERLLDFVNNLGQKIVHQFPEEERLFDYHFKIVKDPQVNAFALPGGYIFVNLGLLQVVEEEAELAMVLGHEMGHVVYRHGTEQLTKAQGFSCCLAITANAVGLGQIQVELINLFGQTGLLFYGRKAELESDGFGVESLHRSHYDLSYAHTFFEKLQKIYKDKPNRLEKMLSTHPTPDVRIQEVKVAVQKYKADPNPIVSTPSFGEMKKVLQKYPSKHEQSQLINQYHAYLKQHGLTPSDVR
ncbi:MAG: M48 family metalloprotease [Deltaproteobacteria bacterium]|nr:M48 family metalloprotease [Deltaproteobacteria bacterium]